MSGVAARYRDVILSNSVIVLAYVVAAALILPALSIIALGRVPAFFRRQSDASGTRSRIEGTGLLLIGFFILADALAADLGRRSDVPQDWILLVWIGLAAGLIGIRYLAGRSETAPRKKARRADRA
jgi:multisubunit Na+/H+ antiporter MnhG subunit